MNSDLIISALAKAVLAGESFWRPRVLVLAIKLGLPKSEIVLGNLLKEHGTKGIAEDYLNCGSPYLRNVAEAWASARGFPISRGGGSRRARWGQF